MNKPNTNERSIGIVIKSWREYRGLRLAQLAESSGCSRPYLSQLESHKIKQPGTDQLGKLAQALDIPLINLISGQLPPLEPELSNQQIKPSLKRSNKLPEQLPIGSIVAHVERLISDARISEQEKQIVAERIVRVTHEMVDLVEATHSLKSVGSSQPVEEILPMGA